MNNDTLLRVGGGVVVVLVAAVLLVQIGRSVDEDEAADPPSDEAPAEEVVERHGLTVRATAPVRVRIESDGVEQVSGVLCRDLECSVSVDHAAEIAVELADLTRAGVIYNGSRVEPLGNLSEARRLVFIDD
ncbi:MAG: hypothetical protein GY913_33725 [Proteobacteria bacterium]|nr:hypothetical protein [Pseudomonadota bacterium]MCP4921888.1 hypothetical protein [Pseudomonadota bacterium]